MGRSWIRLKMTLNRKLVFGLCKNLVVGSRRLCVQNVQNPGVISCVPTTLNNLCVFSTTTSMHYVSQHAEVHKEQTKSLERILGTESTHHEETTEAIHYIMHLKRLPWSVSQEDVKKILWPCKVKSLFFKLLAEGRPSGEAYIELATKKDLNRALSKDFTKLGAYNRNISVSEASKAEMDFAAARNR